MYKRATKTTLVDSSVSTLRPRTSSMTCNYIILFNLSRSINRPLSTLQMEIFRDEIFSGKGIRSETDSLVLSRMWQNKNKQTKTDREVYVVMSTRVCFGVVRGGVSLLSITSNQHESDMTFPQDINAGNWGHGRGIINLKLMPTCCRSFFPLLSGWQLW